MTAASRPWMPYIVGVVMILGGMVAVLAVVWAHRTGSASPHVPPHVKVRIGNWYTRHAGRWT